MIADENGGEVLKHYPSLILGFVQIYDKEVIVVVQTSVEDLPWNKHPRFCVIVSHCLQAFWS